MKADAMNGARKGERRYENALDWLLDALNDPRTPMDTKIKIALALVRVQESDATREGKKVRAKRIAEEASRGNGKFAPAQAPRALRLVEERE